MWDTEQFKIFLTEEKMDRVKKVVAEMLEKTGKLVEIKELASVCGLVNSLRPDMGDIVRLRLRFMLQMVATAEQKFGWKARVILNKRAWEELRFWDNVAEVSGYSLRARPGVVKMRHHWFVSDAGEYLAGGVEWSRAGKKGGTEYQVHLTEKQQKGSSTEREMVEMRVGLKMNLEKLEGCEVRWTLVCFRKTTHLKILFVQPISSGFLLLLIEVQNL